MASLFRSEAMEYMRLTFSKEAAPETLRAIGRGAKFHMVDVSGHDDKTFHSSKRRMAEIRHWERGLRDIEQLMELHGVDAPPSDLSVPDMKERDVVIAIKTRLEPLQMELSRNLEFLKSAKAEVELSMERKIVLEAMQTQLYTLNADIDRELRDMSSSRSGGSSSLYGLSFEEKDPSSSGLQSLDFPTTIANRQPIHSFICGTIPRSAQPQFHRMIFRVSRGNAFAQFLDIPEESTRSLQADEAVEKVVFYVAVIGVFLKRRIEKVADFFRSSRVDMPASAAETTAELKHLSASIMEKGEVLDRTREAIRRTLREIAGSGGHSPLRRWQRALHVERIVCDALSKCSSSHTSDLVIAEGWVPCDSVDSVRNAVVSTDADPKHVIVQVLSERKLSEMPPTYFKLNAFTRTFQDIVDTYGVPRYQEANPGLFTIVSFPFLFGIMYGDIGHGIMMLLLALLLLYYERSSSSDAMKRQQTLGEIGGMIYNGRYLILLMALSALYCGTVYNDCFAVPLNVYGSKWRSYDAPPGTVANASATTWPTEVYPYGVDPGWYHTTNELTFFNSLKMKIAVTFGVVQMSFGICLGLMNHIFSEDYLTLFVEGVPQLIFLLSTFGYMVFMIFYKFTIDWNEIASLGREPPSLIQTMINMFLSPGSVSESTRLYDGQAEVQLFLLLLAVVSVPVMLLGKPLVLHARHKQSERVSVKKRRQPAPRGAEVELPRFEDDVKVDLGHADSEEAAGGDESDKGSTQEPWDLGEAFIHQAIHTVEFVLGAVSNTASYLRLWALSLAHAELSNVFWSKLIMQYGVQESGVMAFIGFAAWFGATFAVLLCMDSLECFLHALRLHWVEFQNKFFHADGYAFAPLTFSRADEWPAAIDSQSG